MKRQCTILLICSAFIRFQFRCVKDVKVITGGMPAEYGGRLSSVLDIRTNDGSTKEFEGTGGIGLLASRLTIDGPIVKDEGSFIVSARRTYATSFSGSQAIRQSTGRAFTSTISMQKQIIRWERKTKYLFPVILEGIISIIQMSSIQLGNATATLRWNHVFAGNLFGTLAHLQRLRVQHNVTSGRSIQYHFRHTGLRLKTDSSTISLPTTR